MLTDMTENAIIDGDIVVYAGRHGDSGTIRLGIVVAADPLVVIGYNKDTGSARKPVLRDPKRSVIVDKGQLPDEIRECLTDAREAYLAS